MPRWDFWVFGPMGGDHPQWYNNYTTRSQRRDIVVKSPWRANRSLGRLRIAWHTAVARGAGATLHPGEH